MNNEGINGIREAPRRIKFTFCNLLLDVRDEKKKYQDFRLQKMPIKFGASLVFALQFAFSGKFYHGSGEDQKPTTLRDLEIDFLKEQLNGFSVEGDYCFGYFEGNKAEMDDLLVSFQALNSTCYVLTESHSKEKNYNRFS